MRLTRRKFSSGLTIVREGDRARRASGRLRGVSGIGTGSAWVTPRRGSSRHVRWTATESAGRGCQHVGMEAVGLDRSVARRGLAVMPPATADPLVGTPGIRVLKPIGARLRGED